MLIDFGINLLAGFSQKAIELVFPGVAAKVIGTPEGRAYKRAFDAAYHSLYAEVRKNGSDADAIQICELFSEFLEKSGAASELLRSAISASELNNVDDWEERFDRACGIEALTFGNRISFDRTFLSFYTGLISGLVIEASKGDSAIFNEVSLAMQNRILDMLMEGQLFSKLTDSSAESQPRTRVIFLAHALYPHAYLERPEILLHACNALIASRTATQKPNTQRLRCVALIGMGGVGKSVLARAICDDEGIIAAFPDGILWTTLGKTPNLSGKLKEWVHALGGVSTVDATLDELKNTLSELLANRSCLLVIDDVWKYRHVEAFDISSTGSCLLVTSRDRAVAERLDPQIIDIPLMTPSESVALLRGTSSPALLEVDLSLLTQVVDRLDYLPLAISLAGTLLRNQDPKIWIESFDIRKLKLPRVEAEHDSLTVTLEMSLDDLPEDIRRLYRLLAIFREGDWIHESAVLHLWSAVDDINAHQLSEILGDLASRSLLIRANSDGVRYVLLHDLLRDLLLLSLDNDQVRNAHKALLGSYSSSAMSSRWHAIPDDGYLHGALVFHLVGAGAISEVRNLFADDRWLHARVTADGGVYDGYLADLNLAWRNAEEMGGDEQSFADCLWYTFLQVAVNTLAQNYSPATIARAFELEIWSFNQAYSAARLILDNAQQATAAILLLRTGKLNSYQGHEIQRLALNSIFSGHHRYVGERERLFAELVPLLDEDFVLSAYEYFLSFTELEVSNSSFSPLVCLRLLVPRLSDDSISELVTLAFGVNESSSPSDEQNVSGVARFVRSHDHEQEYPQYVLLLAELYRRCAHEVQLEVREQVIRSAAELPWLHAHAMPTSHSECIDISPRIHVLAVLLSALDGDAYEHCENMAFADLMEIPEVNLRGTGARWVALKTLKPFLTLAQVQVVLNSGLKAEDDLAQVETLSTILSLLPHDQQQVATEICLVSIENLTWWRRQYAKEAMVQCGVLPSVVQLVERIIKPDIQKSNVEGLASVAACLHSELASTLLSFVDEHVADERVYSECTRSMASHLDEAHMLALLGSSRKLPVDGFQLAAMLARLSKNLPEEICASYIDQALDSALEVTVDATNSSYESTQMSDSIARVIIDLAPFMNAGAHEKALKRLESLHEISYGWNLAGMGMYTWGNPANEWNPRVFGLCALIPHLGYSLIKRSFRAISASTREKYRIHGLEYLCPKLQGNEIQSAVSFVASVTNLELRIRGIVALLQTGLPEAEKEHLMAEALTLCDSMKAGSRSQIEAKGRLLPFIPDEQRDIFVHKLWEELSACEPQDSLYESSLKAMVPFFSDALYRTVFRTILGFQDDAPGMWGTISEVKSLSLAAIAPHAPTDLHEPVMEAAMAQPFGAAGRSRIRVLLALLPALSQPLREKALLACFDIIEQVSEFNITLHGNPRATMLAMLAPFLSEKLVDTGTSLMLNLSDSLGKAIALRALTEAGVANDVVIKNYRLAIAHHLSTMRDEKLDEPMRFLSGSFSIFHPPLITQPVLLESIQKMQAVVDDWVWS